MNFFSLNNNKSQQEQKWKQLIKKAEFYTDNRLNKPNGLTQKQWQDVFSAYPILNQLKSMQSLSKQMKQQRIRLLKDNKLTQAIISTPQIIQDYGIQGLNPYYQMIILQDYVNYFKLDDEIYFQLKNQIKFTEKYFQSKDYFKLFQQQMKQIQSKIDNKQIDKVKINEINQIKNQVNRKNIEIMRKLTNNHQISGKLLKKNNQLTQNKKKLQQEIINKNKYIQNIDDKIFFLTQQRKSLKNKLQNKNQRNIELVQKNEQLRNIIKNKDIIIRSKTDKQNELDKIIKSLKSDKTNHQNLYHRMKKQIQICKQELERIMSEMHKLINQKDRLLQQYQIKKEQVQLLKRKNEQYKQLTIQLEVKSKQLASDQLNSQQQKKRLLKAYNSLVQKKQTLEGELQQLKQNFYLQIQDVKVINRSLQSKNSHLQSQVKSLEVKNQYLSKALQRQVQLKQQLQDNNHHTVEFQRNFDRLNSKIRQQNSNLLHINKLLASKILQYKKLMQQGVSSAQTSLSKIEQKQEQKAIQQEVNLGRQQNKAQSSSNQPVQPQQVIEPVNQHIQHIQTQLQNVDELDKNIEGMKQELQQALSVNYTAGIPGKLQQILKILQNFESRVDRFHNQTMTRLDQQGSQITQILTLMTSMYKKYIDPNVGTDYSKQYLYDNQGQSEKYAKDRIYDNSLQVQQKRKSIVAQGQKYLKTAKQMMEIDKEAGQKLWAAKPPQYWDQLAKNAGQNMFINVGQQYSNKPIRKQNQRTTSPLDPFLQVNKKIEANRNESNQLNFNPNIQIMKKNQSDGQQVGESKTSSVFASIFGLSPLTAQFNNAKTNKSYINYSNIDEDYQDIYTG